MDTEYVDGLCLLDEWIKGPAPADGRISGLKPNGWIHLGTEELEEII